MFNEALTVVTDSMSRVRVLIEQWLPIDQIGAECMREGGVVGVAAVVRSQCLVGTAATDTQHARRTVYPLDPAGREIAPTAWFEGTVRVRFASCVCPLNAITPAQIRLRFNSTPFI